jgi:hypothetical protein
MEPEKAETVLAALLPMYVIVSLGLLHWSLPLVAASDHPLV